MSEFSSITASTSHISNVSLLDETSNGLVPPGSPRPPHAPLAISAAIARFRPTPKEVINGIAPHVFDERRRRRKRSRSPARSAPEHVQPPRLRGKYSSSPLRLSAMIAVDSDGESIIIIEQTEHHRSHPHHLPLSHTEATKDMRPSPECIPTVELPQPVIEISGKIDKTRSRSRFRIDSIRIFKTIAVKLKSSPRA